MSPSLNEKNGEEGAKASFDALEMGDEIIIDMDISLLSSKQHETRDKNSHGSFHDSFHGSGSFSSIKEALSMQSIHEAGFDISENEGDRDGDSFADAPPDAVALSETAEHVKKPTNAVNSQSVEDVQAMIQNLLGSMETTAARTKTTIPPVTRTKEKEACQVESYFHKIDSRTRLNKAAAAGDGGTSRSLRRKKKSGSADDLMDKFLSKSTKPTSSSDGYGSVVAASQNETFGH
jgi:hypothetical protein